MKPLLATLSLLLCSTAFADGLFTSGVIGAGTMNGTQQIIPSISVQPVARTALTNTSQTLSVTASGSPTLQYQWYLASSAVAGATTSSYSTNSTVAETNSYSCIVSNAFGTVASSAANLSWTNGSGGSPGTYSSVGYYNTSPGTTTDFTTAITVGGSSTLVAVGTAGYPGSSAIYVTSVSVSNAVQGNLPLTEVIGARVNFYDLTATNRFWSTNGIPSGSYYVHVKYNSAPGGVSYCACCFTNVNQTTPLGTPAVVDIVSAATVMTNTTTAVSGDMVVDFLGTYSTMNYTFTPTETGQTNIVNDGYSTGGVAFSASRMSGGAGYASTLMSWSCNNAQNWSSVAIAIKKQ